MKTKRSRVHSPAARAKRIERTFGSRRLEESPVEVLHAHVVRVGGVVGEGAGVVPEKLLAAKALDFLQAKRRFITYKYININIYCLKI
jgi:hypothetical protein